MATNAPVLELNTLAEKSFITIDGRPYELLSADVLPVIEYKRLATMLPRIEALWGKEQPTSEEDQELRMLFRSLAAAVVSAPSDILAKLKDLQLVLIYRAFIQLPHATLRRVGALISKEATRPSTPPTGERSAAALAASTGGRPGSGSRKSRQRSSTRQ